MPRRRLDPSSTRSIAVAAALLASTFVAADDAISTGIPFRVLGESLEASSGDPIVLDEDRILLFDHPGGVPRAVPMSEVLGIAVGPVADRDATPAFRTAVRRAGDDAPIAGPYLEFVDGQRILGGLHPAADGAPLWRSAWIRDVPFDLERIRAVRLEEGARVVEAVDADVVVLSNGDELRGLVEEIGTEVSIEVDDAAGGPPRRITVPLHRVASVSLVNPREPGEGAMTWLRGGHRIASRAVRIDEDGFVRLLQPALGGDLAEIPLEFLVAVVPQSERVSPLSSMPVEIGPGGAGSIRPWTPPIERRPGHHPFDAAPLELSGAMRATFTLPDGPARVRGTLERASSGATGRVVVVVRDGDREIARHRLDATSPVAEFAVPIESGRLVLEVEDGGDGPYRDAVVLREAIVVRPGG